MRKKPDSSISDRTFYKVKHFDSKINHKLKVKWIGDKILLNTENTNYSYGTLQEVLNYGLDSIPFTNINNVLVLGMGGGSVIDSLRNRYRFEGPVSAVEIDPVIIKIAEKKFDIKDNHRKNVISADAYEYVQKSTELFDLAIIDIFIDLEVPEKFYSEVFWQHLCGLISVNGFIMFNAGINLPEKKLEQFLNEIPDNFIYQVINNVLVTNTLVILQRIT